MARGSYGAWAVRSADFREIRDIVVSVLEAEGYHVGRRRVTEHDVKVEGIRGSKMLASLVQMIPLAGLFGFGSRVKATVHCRTSLTEAESASRLAVRCAPVQELDSMEEEYLQSQDRMERVGDDRQAGRCFQRLVEALRRAHVLS